MDVILVTGATGNVGSEVVRALVTADAPVRALVRSSTTTVPEGVEVAEGDLADPATLTTALAGVRSVFLLPGYAHGTDLLARMLEAGVEQVVQLSSSAAASGDHSNAITDYMLRSEAAVTQSGLRWTIVRAFGFMSNTLRWAEELAAGDVVVEPFPEVAVAMVDPRDLGTVAARALLEDGHDERTVVVSGPEPLLPRDRLAVLGAALGRDLTIDGLSPDQARDELHRTMPAEYAAAMLDFYAAGSLDEARPVPDLDQLLGRPPRAFSEWVAEHVDAFR